MSETLSSPGRGQTVEHQRPRGRSFLSAVQNSMEHSALPPAPEPEVAPENVAFSFAQWRREHYKRVWRETREEETRVEIGNEVL
jgi:hypothetical protein